MLLAILGIAIGLLIGYFIPLTFATSYSLYYSVGILAAIDSVFGAIRATQEEKFDGVVFGTGFITNAVVAAFLAYIGDYLGVPLYYAAIFAFGVRLFNNTAIIRRNIIEKYRRKVAIVKNVEN